MKELSIKEKAKAYDKAIKRAKSFRTPDNKDVAAYIFPELAESEDEKIRKAMIKYFTNGKEYLSLTPYSREDYIAWLEKKCEQKEDNPPFNDPKYLAGFDTGREVQKIFDEQKPAEWSEDDQSSYNEICNLIYDNYRAEDASRLLTWFNELKDRVLPQPKSDWSEEDEDMINSIIRELIHQYNEEIPQGTEDKIKWLKNKLKSLRPQSQWKPSDEQMYNLSEAAHYRTAFWDCDILIGLYDELKKLREQR